MLVMLSIIVVSILMLKVARVILGRVVVILIPVQAPSVRISSRIVTRLTRGLAGVEGVVGGTRDGPNKELITLGKIWRSRRRLGFGKGGWKMIDLFLELDLFVCLG